MKHWSGGSAACAVELMVTGVPLRSLTIKSQNVRGMVQQGIESTFYSLVLVAPRVACCSDLRRL